jgi:predicted protein tyrosine phosphatase
LGTGGLFLRRLRARVSDQPTGFVWVEKGKVAASGYPASRSQLEWVVSQGIGSILTLTPGPLPSAWAEGLPLQIEHVPMEDHAVPDISALDRSAAFVEEQVKAGKKVLVHCLAGQGRTGCALAAYLVKTRGVGAASALKSLREIKPGFVEWKQEKAITDYAASLKP